jgi:hypothetical protein
LAVTTGEARQRAMAAEWSVAVDPPCSRRRCGKNTGLSIGWGRVVLSMVNPSKTRRRWGMGGVVDGGLRKLLALLPTVHAVADANKSALTRILAPQRRCKRERYRCEPWLHL